MKKTVKIPPGTDLNEIVRELNNVNKSNLFNESEYHFDDWIYEQLPEPLSELMLLIDSPSKRDIGLLSVLTVLSALIKDYKVKYDQKFEGCQLFVYILGDPAQGKGSVEKYRKLGYSFHKEQTERYNEELGSYLSDLKAWEQGKKKGEKPIKPKKRALFLSGNTSKAALTNDLFANDGQGLIFETEADTLYTANKSDFGSFSDILRKAFHSESYSANRVGFEDGAIEIDRLVLSVLLTSTLDQCFNFLPTYDNGLHSRFIFYILPQNLEFKKVFENSNFDNLNAVIDKTSSLFHRIGTKNLGDTQKIFTFSPSQQIRFDEYFQQLNSYCFDNNLGHLKGNVNRLALIFTRLNMLLSYLRTLTSKDKKIDRINISCDDVDFDITLAITDKLIRHLLLLDDLYKNKNPRKQTTLMIHNNGKSNSHTMAMKKEAIDIIKSGETYSVAAEKVLGNKNRKGTISKWVQKYKGFPFPESETSPTISVKEKLENTIVSLFENHNRVEPLESLNLYNLLTSDAFKEEVEVLRNSKPETRKKLKAEMFAFTASGLFGEKRQKEFLIQHSGFICIDIDAKDNEHISNFKNLKQELKNISNAAFIKKSVSGTGYFVLIPLENSDLHIDYFLAIESAFKSLGVNIDKSCKDVARLRYMSYDAYSYMPTTATVFLEVLNKAEAKPSFNFSSNDKEVESLIKKIEESQIDITQTYESWFGIGCSLANTFGEQGRKYFHSISKFHDKYVEKKTDDQYSACLKNPNPEGYKLGTIFHCARENGIL